jgi:hypothetical protein
VVERWRSTTTGEKFRPATSPFEAQLAAQAAAPRLSPGLDAERFSILKKQISIRKEVTDATKRDVPR